MRVLPFTIPASASRSLVVKEEVLPYFYTHFHRHEEIQLTWVHEGDGTLVVGNNMHTFAAGEIYFLGANMPHVFRNDPSYFAPDSNKRINTTTLFFNPYGKIAPLFQLPEVRGIYSFLQKVQGGFKVPRQSQRAISGHIDKVRETAGIDQLMYFFQLLTSLSGIAKLEPLTNDLHAQSVSDSEGIRIGEIYNYILQNYDRDISLNEVTAVAHMTPQAFCRYFKKHTGHTFIAFLNEVRINEACKNLTNGGYESIGAIAYNCGFNSITHFNRIFKKIKGKSPKEYIDEYSNNTG